MAIFNAVDAAHLRAQMDASFVTTMDVYGESEDGSFSTLLRAGVACRLASGGQAATAANRAEMTMARTVYWDSRYDLPEDTVQLAIQGRRWNPIPGSYEANEVAPGEVVYRRASLVQVR